MSQLLFFPESLSPQAQAHQLCQKSFHSRPNVLDYHSNAAASLLEPSRLSFKWNQQGHAYHKQTLTAHILHKEISPLLTAHPTKSTYRPQRRGNTCTMRDLRKKALLESGKTVSKKARTRESTPPISRGISPSASPRGSRVASRNVSDDESELSDGTQWGSDSIDALIAPSEVEAEDEEDAWIADLNERVEALCDRKRSATEGREDVMRGVCSIMTRHYARDEIQPRLGELLSNLLKSVRNGQSEREVVLALKLIALILVTDPSETIYDAVHGPFKGVINDSQYPEAKIAAIHALGVATFYGGASEGETEEVMEFLLDIASSDGAVIEEADNAQAVVAALEEWGFLATQLEDVEDLTEAAMDTFVDQLDSSDANVQIAAGDNIALLYEKSYTEAESDDEPEEADDDEERNPGPRMVKRYTVYRQTHQLQQQLEALAKASSKRISKKDRKNLHLSFKDVITTVEKPARGPRYSTALNDEGREYGSRLKVSIGRNNKMTIDKWWKLHRLNGLKRLLQGGFLVHYEFNQTVFDSLPVIIEDD